MLEKVIKVVKKVGFIVKRKVIYYELRYYLNKRNKTYLKRVYDSDRRTGKTTALIKLAKEFSCPIVVASYGYGDNIKSMCKSMGIEGVRVIVVSENLAGLKFSKLLVEEGLTPAGIAFIQHTLASQDGCLVGFKRV